MGGRSHYIQIINDCIEITIYSDGAIGYEDAINMSADELPYIIHTFKKHYEAKEKNRQDFIKSVMEFANKGLDQLFKLLAKIGGKNR